MRRGRGLWKPPPGARGGGERPPLRVRPGAVAVITAPAPLGALGLALACGTALALAACGVLRPVAPATGRSEEPKRRIILATEVDDTRFGEEHAEEVEQEFGLLHDPDLLAYVDTIGQRLVPYARKRAFTYHFGITDQDEPNALALPGGYVYIARGALVLANSEDELANVIAHEIAHVAERHSAAQQEVVRRGSPLLMPLFRILRLLAYNRDQERSADNNGQRIAAAAGYDPMGMARFFDQMRDLARLNPALSFVPAYFLTHPDTPERVTDATVRSRELDFSRTPETDSRPADYLRRIDGLLLGGNPAEGVFRDETFFHPDLGLRIRFPEGWTLENTRAAVGAISPDGAARIFLTLEPLEPDPRRAAHAFLEREGEEYNLAVLRERAILLGELPAYRLEITGYIEGQTVSGHLTFVSLGERTYRLTAAAPLRQANAYLGRARVTARSLRALTPEERAEVRALRLRAVTARPDENLLELGERTGNEWDVVRTAVMNGLDVVHSFSGGEVVKIARLETYVPAPQEAAPDTAAGAAPSEPEADAGGEPAASPAGKP